MTYVSCASAASHSLSVARTELNGQISRATSLRRSQYRNQPSGAISAHVRFDRSASTARLEGAFESLATTSETTWRLRLNQQLCLLGLGSQFHHCLGDLFYRAYTGDALHGCRRPRSQPSPRKYEDLGYWGYPVLLSASATRHQISTRGQRSGGHRIDRRGLGSARPLYEDPFTTYHCAFLPKNYGHFFPIVKLNLPAQSPAYPFLLAPSSSALRVVPTC